MNINQKLKILSEHLERGLVGRRDHARMLLLAAVAGENAILFGPPGTAKSLLARRLKDCFVDDIKYFECLLTKFSMPEEVFGPVSLKGLEQDIFRRVYDRYMPGAGIAFIDETFKANSAILNSMLTILNEREFDTGNERIKVPLRCVVGASNEMPKESELEALYDRFIIRMTVNKIEGDDNLESFLKNKDDYIPPEKSLRLSKSDLDEITDLTKKIPIEDSLINLLKDLRTWCYGKKIFISDRRLGKIKRLIQVAAVTSNRKSAGIVDSWVIRYCAWEDFTSSPSQAENLAEWLDNRIDKDKHDLTKLKTLVETEKDSYNAKANVQKKDSKGKLIYIDSNGSETDKASSKGYKVGEKLLSEEETKEWLLKNRRGGERYHRDIFINNRWENVDDYFSKNFELETVKHKPQLTYGVYTNEQLDRFKKGPAELCMTLKTKAKEIVDQISVLEKSLDDSPWTPKSYQENFLIGLKANLQELSHLSKDLEDLIKGYEKFLTSSDPEKLSDPKA